MSFLERVVASRVGLKGEGFAREIELSLRERLPSSIYIDGED